MVPDTLIIFLGSWLEGNFHKCYKHNVSLLWAEKGCCIKCGMNHWVGTRVAGVLVDVDQRG